MLICRSFHFPRAFSLVCTVMKSHLGISGSLIYISLTLIYHVLRSKNTIETQNLTLGVFGGNRLLFDCCSNLFPVYRDRGSHVKSFSEANLLNSDAYYDTHQLENFRKETASRRNDSRIPRGKQISSC